MNLVTRVTSPRDLFLLVAATGVGVIVYNYFAVSIALLGLSLVQWTGVSAGTPAAAISAVPEAVASFTLAALLVLAIARLAHEPRRLASLLAIAYPTVWVIGFAAYVSDSSAVVDAVGFAIHSFAVECLAFAGGCLLTSKLLPGLR